MILRRGVELSPIGAVVVPGLLLWGGARFERPRGASRRPESRWTFPSAMVQYSAREAEPRVGRFPGVTGTHPESMFS